MYKNLLKNTAILGHSPYKVLNLNDEAYPTILSTLFRIFFRRGIWGNGKPLFFSRATPFVNRMACFWPVRACRMDDLQPRPFVGYEKIE